MPSIGKLETFTRIGFAARGVLYILIGWLTLRSGQAADNVDALHQFRGGIGQALLIAMAAGFAAYGLWRISEALLDTEGHGTGANGIAARLGGAVSGLVHFGLCLYAIRLATGIGSGAGSGRGGGSREAGASAALGLPGGQTLLMAIAVVVALVGLYQMVKAVKLGFLKHLDPGVAAKPAIAWIGRAGYAARGIVFVVIGWILWKAADHVRAAEAGGTGEAMDALPLTLRLVVAVGLVFFGIFSLVEARYRRITDPQVLSRLKQAGRRVARA